MKLFFRIITLIKLLNEFLLSHLIEFIIKFNHKFTRKFKRIYITIKTLDYKVKIVVSFMVIISTILLSLFFPYIRVLSSSSREVRNNFKILCDDNPLKIIFVDVSQGDCIIIKHLEEVLIIDSGPKDSLLKIKAYLDALNVKKIKWHIVTHPHDDHNGSTLDLMNSFEIENIVINKPTSFIMQSLNSSFISSSNINESILKNNKRSKIYYSEDLSEINMGNLNLDILHPKRTITKGSLNNLSFTTLITFKNLKILLCGDLEKEFEVSVANGNQNKIKNVNIFKANHHGSNTSNCEEFVRYINPQFSIISCGLKNSFGHPNLEVLKRLLKYSKKVYRTDKYGSIIFTSDGKNIKHN